MMIVYYSSASGNTHRFVESLRRPSLRIVSGNIPLVEEDYILVVPTYADGLGNDALADEVEDFLKAGNNSLYFRGVVGCGNRNFGELFCVGARNLSKRFNIPLLHTLELSGLQSDVEKVRDIVDGVSRNQAPDQTSSVIPGAAPNRKGPSEVPQKKDYHELNAMLNLFGKDGKFQLGADRDAVRAYFLQHVNQNTVFFHSLREKIDYLIEEGYYEPQTFDLYSFDFVKSLYRQVYSHKFRFETFLGALKYYVGYTMKNFDGDRYLERFEDRVCMVALVLAKGDESQARLIAEEIITGRFQPATPTFLNAGKTARGELVSCFLLRFEDNMESISRGINASLQLSKRGGGVAMNLSNIREFGAPIKKMKGQSSGVIPVMKILEDSFSYANQLGARQGAGAVWLHAHHMDILRFLDTKRENADEKIRIKTLSLGVVIPDITFELAARNEDMYLFSPYDVERIYGVPFTEISITERYDDLVENPEIRKSKINARQFFQMIAEIQFESGYPYILYEDTANAANPIRGRITMSNLCSEILQVSEESLYNEDLSYKYVGTDISCNLGSMNIAKSMDGRNIGRTVEAAIRALTSVSEISNLASVPSIVRGNNESHAIGLGQMNLHGFLAREEVMYGSDEALEIVDAYFRTVRFHALSASNKIAVEKGESFVGFENSEYYSGVFFDQYTSEDPVYVTEKARSVIEKFGLVVPSVEDWKSLAIRIRQGGLYNRNLLAIPPTGSISYINNSTASIHPIASMIEVRKEGKVGRVYYPAPYLSETTMPYYRDAYELGYKPLVDTYAVATKHTDQGLSLTLFLKAEITTRDINKIQIYAWRKGIKTIYYIRLRQDSLEGTGVKECVSCAL